MSLAAESRRRSQLLALLSLFALVAPAGQAKGANRLTPPKPGLPTLLAATEANYARAGSLSAEFSQEDISAAFGEKKASSGTLSWKSPDSLRWETKSPEANLVVSNGRTVWLYTPPFDETESGQVIIRKTSAVKSRMLDALVAGRFSGLLRQGMAISSTAKRSFVLKPSKRASGNLKQVSITLDQNSPIISKVAIEYRDGNRSTIELSQVRMGEKLPGSLFDFKIPPRTDVVRE